MEVTGANNDLGRDQFLQLLVTQLQNQDPLDPMKNEEFLAQLAQFSTLEGIEQLNASFSDLLALQQLTEGSSLIGKLITYQADGTSTAEEATVERVTVQDGKLLLLTADGTLVHVTDIRSVAAPETGAA
jgi:flagellar basal-body rod modification protein FlgD